MMGQGHGWLNVSRHEFVQPAHVCWIIDYIVITELIIRVIELREIEEWWPIRHKYHGTGSASY